MPYWAKAAVFIIAAVTLVRIGGKRAISQMAVGEVVIMIALGELMIHPMKTTNTWKSVYGGSLLIAGLLLISYICIYFPKVKNCILGQPVIVIENGVTNLGNLKRSRMTPDELKMRLRIKDIQDVAMVKSASLEISGELGVELYPEYDYATKKDVEELKQTLQLIASRLEDIPQLPVSAQSQLPHPNLFEQVKQVQTQDPLQ